MRDLKTQIKGCSRLSVSWGKLDASQLTECLEQTIKHSALIATCTIVSLSVSRILIQIAGLMFQILHDKLTSLGQLNLASLEILQNIIKEY